ncbi:MAG TPA: hypothetical protein ENI68_03180, partial [Gammaproteobacteria bacterium]|nr:hypothetical protein [Gammaproteobacteria bacterium]
MIHRLGILYLGCLLVCLPAAGTAAVIDHSGTISAHTTWGSADVHRITDNVTVAAGIILTIEPGAVVKFNSGRWLRINGAISAVGTPANRIIFTSYRDDSAGGDSNGDGPSSGAPGDWGNIYLGASITETLSQIQYIDVRYAGSGNTGSIYIDQNDLAIKDSVISDGSSHGISLYGNASPVLDGNVIRG